MRESVQKYTQLESKVLDPFPAVNFFIIFVFYYLLT